MLRLIVSAAIVEDVYSPIIRVPDLEILQSHRIRTGAVNVVTVDPNTRVNRHRIQAEHGSGLPFIPTDG